MEVKIRRARRRDGPGKWWGVTRGSPRFYLRRSEGREENGDMVDLRWPAASVRLRSGELRCGRDRAGARALDEVVTELSELRGRALGRAEGRATAVAA
jgi:hypothetical protein